MKDKKICIAILIGFALCQTTGGGHVPINSIATSYFKRNEMQHYDDHDTSYANRPQYHNNNNNYHYYDHEETKESELTTLLSLLTKKLALKFKLKAALLKPLLILGLIKVKLIVFVGKSLIFLAVKKYLLKKLLIKLPFILLKLKFLWIKLKALKVKLLIKGLFFGKKLSPLLVLLLLGALAVALKVIVLLALSLSMQKVKEMDSHHYYQESSGGGYHSYSNENPSYADYESTSHFQPIYEPMDYNPSTGDYKSIRKRRAIHSFSDWLVICGQCLIKLIENQQLGQLVEEAHISSCCGE